MTGEAEVACLDARRHRVGEVAAEALSAAEGLDAPIAQELAHTVRKVSVTLGRWFAEQHLTVGHQRLRPSACRRSSVNDRREACLEFLQTATSFLARIERGDQVDLAGLFAQHAQFVGAQFRLSDDDGPGLPAAGPEPLRGF